MKTHSFTPRSQKLHKSIDRWEKNNKNNVNEDRYPFTIKRNH